ncbi:helix-turn-helix domain-containing protein [Mycolicibacterium goodii]|uniref:helix-turn-helix domain-containing protein n=1 Tax=Mycolicibacterium goodii TaxID=134601 RepID=UPI0035566A98
MSIRKERMKQGSMARRLRISPPAVSHFETGRDNNPTLARVEQYAAMLGYRLTLTPIDQPPQ